MERVVFSSEFDGFMSNFSNRPHFSSYGNCRAVRNNIFQIITNYSKFGRRKLSVKGKRKIRVKVWAKKKFLNVFFLFSRFTVEELFTDGPFSHFDEFFAGN